jgi:UDP-N-acetylmuramoyl-tripeptide--D-alanyl-D-alanine ligase
MGMEGIRFRFHQRTPGKSKVESLHVKVPLLGRHSVHTALCAAAVGLVDGLSWAEIVAGLQMLAGQLRLVAVNGINDSTLIDDTYNASPASTVAALNLLADISPAAGGRRVAVLGDMRELGSYETEGHKIVGRRAADVLDVLVTVGELGASIGAEAREAGFPPANLHILPTHTTPSTCCVRSFTPTTWCWSRAAAPWGWMSSSPRLPPTEQRQSHCRGAGAWIIHLSRAWPMRWRWAR